MDYTLQYNLCWPRPFSNNHWIYNINSIGLKLLLQNAKPKFGEEDRNEGIECKSNLHQVYMILFHTI